MSRLGFGAYTTGGAIAAVLALAAFATPSRAALTVQADATGIAGTTADFHGVSFASGTPGTFVQSISYQLPFGFYDFDGVDNYANQTAPILHAPSLVGLTASDISFTFTGPHPTTLTAQFAPGAFAPGDSFRFAADLDGAISDVGGGFGGGDGTLITVTTYDGQTASANFRTNTSVQSTATVTLVPEATAPTLLLGTLAAAQRRRRWRRSA